MLIWRRSRTYLNIANQFGNHARGCAAAYVLFSLDQGWALSKAPLFARRLGSRRSLIAHITRAGALARRPFSNARS